MFNSFLSVYQRVEGFSRVNIHPSLLGGVSSQSAQAVHEVSGGKSEPKSRPPVKKRDACGKLGGIGTCFANNC